MADDWSEGSPRYYKHIVAVLATAFISSAVLLLVLNVTDCARWLEQVLGQAKAFFVQLYFWGAMGATVASYKFLADDKDLNELEGLKAKPDPTVLRYPNLLDVYLYGFRVALSGILALVGACIFLAGLGYFDASPDSWGTKQRLFFIILAFLIGLYQDDFLTFLSTLRMRLLRQRGAEGEVK